MMNNEFEEGRRARLDEINRNPQTREGLEAQHGQVWDTRELARDFVVVAFLAPYVMVRRKTDGVIGSLEFQAQPRFYFNFVADERYGTSASCPWCHRLNPVGERYCRDCGHEAHTLRTACLCPQCAAGAAGEMLTEEDVEAAVEQLRRERKAGRRDLRRRSRRPLPTQSFLASSFSISCSSPSGLLLSTR